MGRTEAAGLGFSRRCDFIVRSEIRNMSVECEKVGGLNLSQGVCDLPTPDPVAQGAIKAILDGNNSYTRHDGVAELRGAIARKLKDFNGIAADPETEIVVSGGSTGAMYSAFMALLNPGDEVILFEPYYGYHVQTLLAVDAVPVYVRMTPPDWSFSPEDVERAITPKTRAMIINTPGNPSGKIFSRKEFEFLVALAVKHDLFIFTDEIYEYITYDGHQHISPATIPGAAERTITISGFSKTFSITGWRLGYSVSAPKWAQMIGYMSDLVYVCPPSPLQYGAAKGLLELGPEYYAALCEDLHVKRELICRALEQGGLRPFKPAGAYYVLADVSRVPGATGKEKAMRLLEKTGVACVPGEAFFHKDEDGDNVARFCYAKPDDVLTKACERLAALKL
jgi:aminotransferase